VLGTIESERAARPDVERPGHLALGRAGVCTLRPAALPMASRRPGCPDTRHGMA
jgi:hypothetical protein